MALWNELPSFIPICWGCWWGNLFLGNCKSAMANNKAWTSKKGSCSLGTDLMLWGWLQIYQFFWNTPLQNLSRTKLYHPPSFLDLILDVYRSIVESGCFCIEFNIYSYYFGAKLDEVQDRQKSETSLQFGLFSRLIWKLTQNSHRIWCVIISIYS